MSNDSQTNYQICQECQNIANKRSMVTNLHISYHQMTNLRNDEMVLFRNLTKIGTDENKSIYSMFSTKVKVKVTRSFTLVSFLRV